MGWRPHRGGAIEDTEGDAGTPSTEAEVGDQGLPIEEQDTTEGDVRRARRMNRAGPHAESKWDTFTYCVRRFRGR